MATCDFSTINDWNESRKLQLITNYNQMGLRASGSWALSLNPSVIDRGTGIIVQMQANGYSQQMIKGRRKNLNQDPETIRKWVGWAGNTFIKEWVKDKGLTLNPFAVAYSIAINGIDVPNKHNTGELMDGVLSDENINELLQIAGNGILKSFRDDLINIK